MYLAFGVESVLFNTSLTVSRDAVLVPQSPRLVMVLPQMVILVHFGSGLDGCTSHTTRVCATSLWRSKGMSVYLITFIVLVPATRLVFGMGGCCPTPWQRRPILFA